MYLVRAGCCISSRQVVRLKASYSTATSRKTDTVLSLVKEGKIQRALDHFMEDPSDCLGACALLRNLGKSGDIDTALHVYRHYANDLIPDNEMMTIVLDMARKNFNTEGNELENSERLAILRNVLWNVWQVLTNNPTLEVSPMLLSLIVSACADASHVRFADVTKDICNKYIFTNKVTADSRLCAVILHSLQKSSDFNTAKSFFEWMKTADNSNEIFGEYVYTALFSICAEAKQFELGQHIYEHLLETRASLRFRDPNEILRRNTALVMMYGKCKGLREAIRMFEEVRKEGEDTILWNSVLGLCLENTKEEKQEPAAPIDGGNKRIPLKKKVEMKEGQFSVKEAKALFMKMLEIGIPFDGVTFATLIALCTRARDLEFGKEVNEKMSEVDASKKSQEGRSLVSENLNSLLKMYAKCSGFDVAANFFSKHMTDVKDSFSDLPDPSNWETLLLIAPEPTTVISLFEEMLKRSVEPTDKSWTLLFNATARSRMGKEFCSSIEAEFEKSEAHRRKSQEVLVALLNMYGRCRGFSEAFKLFNSEDAKIRETPRSWTALIGTCKEEKRIDDALLLFRQMIKEGVRPDNMTYVALLSLCGLNEEILSHIRTAFGSEPFPAPVFSELVMAHVKYKGLNHFASYYPQLLKEQVARNGGQVNHPDSRLSLTTWKSLLSQCCQQKLVNEAIVLLEHMLQEGTQPDAATFKLLVEICTKSGTIEQARKIHGYLLSSPLSKDK